MVFLKEKLEGSFVIDLEKREDVRGFYARTWCRKEFEGHGLKAELIQSNLVLSKQKGTLRGLHYQAAPYEEAKVVRCTRGAIFDVIVDVRPQSPTYRQWIGVELTEDNYRMLYVPEGCAHGFLVLRDNTEVIYHVTQYYTPALEQGIRWNDPFFNIEWPETDERIVSNKDQMWPLRTEFSKVD